jgi:hypothetical protein
LFGWTKSVHKPKRSITEKPRANEIRFYKEEFDPKAHALAVEAVLRRFLQRGGKIGKTRNEQMAFMQEVQT